MMSIKDCSTLKTLLAWLISAASFNSFMLLQCFHPILLVSSHKKEMYVLFPVLVCYTRLFNLTFGNDLFMTHKVNFLKQSIADLSFLSFRLVA